MGPAGRLVTIRRSGADGAHFPLSLRSCLFGRGVECDIRIQLPVVSRQHCKIEVGEQAVLFNLSSANPTQVNGAPIDGPVRLKHGDVITVIDRSFRYEDDRHQSGSASASAEFPGQAPQPTPGETEAAVSNSVPSVGSLAQRVESPELVSCFLIHCQDGEAEGRGAARSQLTEEGASGEPPARSGGAGAARAVSRSSGGPAARSTPDGRRSEPLRDNRRHAAGSLAGGLGEGARGTLVSRNGGAEALPLPWALEKGGEKESPFRKLYESMKEKLDVKSEKENVLQSGRKSGSRGHCAADFESAGGSWGEMLRQGSPGCRRRSRRSSQTKAVPAPGQREEEKASEGPGPTLEATESPSVPPRETMEASTPVQSRRNSSPKRRSGGQSSVQGSEPANPEWSAAFTPKELFPGHGTPASGEGADGLRNTPEKASSRKRRSSLPAKVDIVAAEAETPKPAALTPLLVPVERKGPGGSLGPPQPRRATAGPPGLGSTGVGDWDESIYKVDGVPLKTRRVSFGGHLRPELFDENLPPNTPLKRGETPTKRRSLVPHAPAVLKKIIKGQPQESGKGDSSEIRLEVTTQDVSASSPAGRPTRSSSGANDGRRRSSKPPAWSGSQSPRQTEAPKRGGRRSSGGAPAQRAAAERGQQGLLQMIQSRRRSGASEANLIVAKSWADIVKLSAKQTQAKAVKRGPPRQPSKRQRRAKTPKKPAGRVYSEFSTGHANSPCTIVIGKAHVEKVTVPARPYRMLNNLVFDKKIDFNEDLSGLTEMFKTPAKEKPKKMSLCPTTFSSSEGLLGQQVQGPESEEKPPLRAPAKSATYARPHSLTQVTVSFSVHGSQYNTGRRIFLLSVLLLFIGENVSPNAQNVPEELLDKKSASPALRRQYMTVNKIMKTPPSETEPSKAASSVNRPRRSAGLRSTPVPGTECEQEDPELDTVESISGRGLGKSPGQAWLAEREMKESEGAFATWNGNLEPKENSEKKTVARRSRRSSELKGTPRADVIATKRPQEMESTEDLLGTHSLLQTPGHAEAPVGVEHGATGMCTRSPKPEPVGTPAKETGQIKTPSRSVRAEALSALGKPAPTPGGTEHTHTEPAGADESMKASQKFSEQQQDSADHVIGSRRRSRTPKRKPQPIEDLAGLKQLFQTPKHTVETATDEKTMKIPSKSPKPEPVSTPTSTKRRLRTPLGKVDGEGELSALGGPTPTPGRITRSPRAPAGDDEDITALTRTPEQKLDSAEQVTGSRRRSRTPKRKAEPTEDLTGFRELFQTPSHAFETVTEVKTVKIPSKSPKPEPFSTPTSTKRRLRTPVDTVDVEGQLSALREPTPTPGESTHFSGEPAGDDEDITALKETPEQKLDSAEQVTGSRRRSRTPKRKAEPTEDLAGLKELFQTPNHVVETLTNNKATKILSKSPKPEPVSTLTSTKRRLRTPLGKVEGELSALREPTPTPGESMRSAREPEGDADDIGALKGTPEQQRDSSGHVSGSRRRSRTPKRKVEPTEDLNGFKELFQTPNHVVGPVTEDITMKTPSKSPKPEPVGTPSSTKRRLRTPVGKVDTEEEFLALRGPTPTPGRLACSPRAPAGDDEDITALMGTPEQKLDSAKQVTGSRRRSRTPKRKAEPTEDLAGLKELFQTPNHVVETLTNNKATKILSKSPKPEPVSTPTSTKRRLRTPVGTVDVEGELSALREPTPTPEESTHSAGEPEGDADDIRVLKGTPEQKRDSAEHVTGSRRRSRTPTRVNQPTEDLAGLKELFQTPQHTVESMIEDKATDVPCKSAQAKPAVVPTGRTRRLRAPAGKAAVRGELSALQSPARASGRTTRSHRELEGGDKDMKLFKEPPEQKLRPAENVPASKRKPRTRKEKAQIAADPASLQELSRTPDHTEDPVAVADSAEMPSGSPQAEAVVMPARTRRQLRAPPRTVAVQEEPSALRRPTGTSGKTTRLHREQEGADKDMKLFKESPEQKLDPAEDVPASKRKPRTRKEKAQIPADPASLQELSRTPDRTEDPVAVADSAEMPSGSPQAEAVVMPARTRRQLRAPPRTVAVQEEPTALRRPTGTSGKTTQSHRKPVDGAEDTEVCQGPPRREPGPVGTAVGSGRQLRSRPGKAQPPHSPAGSRRLLRSPARDEELGTDAAGLTRTSTQAPDQSKPETTSRRTRRARDEKPSQEPVDSRDPEKAPSESSVALSPKRKREDGSCAGARRLRLRTRAQDPAEETPPPQKRLRTAPREQQCAPPEPSEPKRGRRVLREVIEPVDDLPSANGKTKNKGRKEDVASPDKGVSLRSGLPNKTRGAEQRPELPVAAEKGQRKRNEKKPGKSSQEVEIQNLEGGARSSAPGDKVHERRMSPRPGRRGAVPVPRGAEEKAQASSVETRGATQEEKGGAPRPGVIRLRSRKVAVPPAGDALESQPKQRATRSAKRPVEDANKSPEGGTPALTSPHRAAGPRKRGDGSAAGLGRFEGAGVAAAEALRWLTFFTG
ncbi:proliferation marker protein Ki-67 [Phyllostomus discolor]|uniref:Proliferation marker protein Ki-67 n=1 Tax=Phyllostomus discolor TaxID=89673 RepID=A0A7E6DX05_9CHIR|nr:proliferation marker protein Ki-67 [Phyllostomus discolor]